MSYDVWVCPKCGIEVGAIADQAWCFGGKAGAAVKKHKQVRMKKKGKE